jgi:hypothetical protein
LSLKIIEFIVFSMALYYYEGAKDKQPEQRGVLHFRLKPLFSRTA